MLPPNETEDNMSFFVDPLQVNAPRPPPELFDIEFGGLEYDGPFQYQPESTFPGLPVTPSTTVYSTDYGHASSQYSVDFNLSDYSVPSDLPSNGPGAYITHYSHGSDIFSDTPSSATGSQLSDCAPSGLYDHPVLELSPADLSHVLQSLVIPVPPAPVPVQVTPDAQTDIARAEAKPFKCPHSGCPFASARKYNLNTHINTHDKEKSKRFICSICMSRLTRKHDLRRHYTTQHGGKRSALSAHANSTMDSELATGGREEVVAWITGV